MTCTYKEGFDGSATDYHDKSFWKINFNSLIFSFLYPLNIDNALVCFCEKLSILASSSHDLGEHLHILSASKQGLRARAVEQLSFPVVSSGQHGSICTAFRKG